ncbi:MAG TPA: hypothetical protein DCF68_06120 [Cyanothece sp. UBA12306]|nr:hypothetical protein [Cyanothece sp. UBA12306]
MKSSMFQSSSVLTTICGVLSAGMLLSSLSPVQAKPFVNGELLANNVTFVPPDGDQPRDTQGGASRGGKCPKDDQSLNPYLTPVIPANAQRLTSQPQAKIFVYIPQTAAKKAFVSLKDDKNQHHYQTFLPLEKKGGIVQISLPDDAPDLSVGTEYKWSFAIVCGDRLLPDDPTVTGTIRRINLDQKLTNQVKNLGENPSLEQADLLGKSGLWYDMLTVLVSLKTEQPNNLQLDNIWSNILKLSNLEKIATQPIIANK